MRSPPGSTAACASTTFRARCGTRRSIRRRSRSAWSAFVVASTAGARASMVAIAGGRPGPRSRHHHQSAPRRGVFDYLRSGRRCRRTHRAERLAAVAAACGRRSAGGPCGRLGGSQQGRGRRRVGASVRVRRILAEPSGAHAAALSRSAPHSGASRSVAGSISERSRLGDRNVGPGGRARDALPGQDLRGILGRIPRRPAHSRVAADAPGACPGAPRTAAVASYSLR